MTCETCEGRGRVPDYSGNFPSHPGVTAGPFIELMECPTCHGDPATLPDHYACDICGVVKHCDEMLVPSDHSKCEDLVCSQSCADDWNDRLAERIAEDGTI